jgi:hypothetical protein
MIADGLMKALPRQKFRDFIRTIGLVDIRDRLQAKKRQEALKEQAANAAAATATAAAEAMPTTVSEPERRGKGYVTTP